MALKYCSDECTDAPFPHIEVLTAGRINPRNGDEIPGKKYILCADCKHYWNRPRGNCKCPESCHISDLVESDS